MSALSAVVYGKPEADILERLLAGVVNVLAPHLGISVWVFWVSTFLGIGGVSYIHVTIGTTLDQMASSEDFHIISLKNGIGLGGIIVAVLVPVLLKRYYKKDIDDAA